MPAVYTTGVWRPNTGEEDGFVEEWAEFARWASDMLGAGTVRLTRDLRDPGRFVSFARWESIEAVRAWKSSPEFKERMSRVQRHVDAFAPTELELVASFERGAAAS